MSDDQPKQKYANYTESQLRAELKRQEKDRAKTAGFDNVEDYREWIAINEESIEGCLSGPRDAIFPKDETPPPDKAPHPLSKEIVLTDEQVTLLAAHDWRAEDYLDLEDHELGDDLVNLFRVELKLPKPQKVTESTWRTPIELKPRHRKVIHLAALGKTRAIIAEETGYSPAFIDRLLASHNIKRRIRAKQESLFEGDAKMTMKVLMNKAFGTIEEIIEGDGGEEIKASTRLDASKFVIDHVIGKATQSVDIKHSTLAEFMRRLDERSADPVLPAPAPSQVIDVTSSAPIDTPKDTQSDDPIDDLVASFSVVEVGKRGS